MLPIAASGLTAGCCTTTVRLSCFLIYSDNDKIVTVLVAIVVLYIVLNDRKA